MSALDIDRFARDLLAAFDEKRQITPLSALAAGLDLDQAYRIATRIRELRQARGERPIGRKIGFTNRTIWDEYKVYAPIWGYMYETTVEEAACSCAVFSPTEAFEPRIEPEIVFHFARAPNPGMDEAALLDCIDWFAHGIEIVQSLYPGWAFTAADTVAGFGLHAGLIVGPRRQVGGDRSYWLGALADFNVTLFRGGAIMERGHASNVLGGPLSALRHLVRLLESDDTSPALSAGEIVTTGTLTRALPLGVGETWRSSFEGLDLTGIEIAFQ